MGFLKPERQVGLICKLVALSSHLLELVDQVLVGSPEEKSSDLDDGLMLSSIRRSVAFEEHECPTKTPLGSFEEAKEKIGEYAEYYNFKRPHQGIGNVTPSDRFYRVADRVKQIGEANTQKVAQAPPAAAISASSRA